MLREGIVRAQEAGGPECRPQGLERAVEAPPRRTPAGRARRASAAASDEPEAATEVGRRRDAPRPVLRAGESGPGEGGVDTGDTATRDLHCFVQVPR